VMPFTKLYCFCRVIIAMPSAPEITTDPATGLPMFTDVDAVDHGRTPVIDFVMTHARLPMELMGPMTPESVVLEEEAKVTERSR
jgi:hypothetical protein